MRRFLPVSLTIACLVLAGCSTPPKPEITFYAAGEYTTAAPHLYCANTCARAPEATVSFPVPAGKPLQISVPSELAEAPWIVAFRYRTPDGKPQEARSKLFSPGARHAYTLRLPDEGATLTEVEISRLTGIQPPGKPGGEMQFVSNATWTLRTT